MKNFKGVILAEALISISILTTAVMVLGTITNNAISTTQISKDYLVAENLVTEGIEAVKVIRAGNWMKKPSQKDCWLDIKVSDCNEKAMAGGNYIAKNENGLWILEKVSSDVAGSDNGLDMEKGIKDKAESTYITPFQLYLQDDGGVKKFVAAKSAPANSTASRFFRSVKFTSVDSTNNLQASFEVKVQWLDGAKVRTIKKVLTISNYL